jgi:hypothetical protein
VGSNPSWLTRGALEELLVRSVTWTGVAAATGGLLFAGFWIGSLVKVEIVPWPVALLWHGIATFLLAIGAAGIHRSAPGSSIQTTLGWLGVALVVIGQLVSLEITMLGSLIFGAAAVMSGRRARWGGALLALGAAAFLGVTAVNGRFWGEPNPSPSLVPALTFGAALLLIALGWIALGVIRRDEPMSL